jgi:hypothetical protein
VLPLLDLLEQQQQLLQLVRVCQLLLTCALIVLKRGYLMLQLLQATVQLFLLLLILVLILLDIHEPLQQLQIGGTFQEHRLLLLLLLGLTVEQLL